MKAIKISLTLIICLFTINAIAHIGGHYHKNDGTKFSVWVFKSGNIIKGNFYSGKANTMLVEQNEGRLIMVNVDSLIPQSQLLARFKIRRIAQLNAPIYTITNQSPLSEKKYNYYFLGFSILLSLICCFMAKQIIIYLHKPNLAYNKNFILVVYLLCFIFSAYACNKSAQQITNTTTTTSIPKTTTSFLDSAFAAYKPAIATSYDNTYYYVSSSGIPNHNMMLGITSWQQQIPIPQAYTGSNSWSIPLQPAYASKPLSLKSNLMMGAVAIAVNGIPIFNALNNRGEDSNLIGELDQWGGHCGRADDYHYHVAPLHLSTTSGLQPIAFALDGFAVYANKEPDGSAMAVLDTCHGHVYNKGVYHYHGSTTYPYAVGAMRGQVTLDPTTTAPQNQVIPQSHSSGIRPSRGPLNGAKITAFSAPAANSYLIIYQIGTKQGSISYSWDANFQYHFIYTDTEGKVTDSVYKR